MFLLTSPSPPVRFKPLVIRMRAADDGASAVFEDIRSSPCAGCERGPFGSTDSRRRVFGSTDSRRLQPSAGEAA
ncbi:unnamed protein product [Gadus morhua 'NCC']